MAVRLPPVSVVLWALWAAFIVLAAGPADALPLEVFLVPHSHCDAGWLLSADTYFSYEWPHMPPAHQGSGGSVRATLDTVLQELLMHPTYRFVWSETIWFDKWWALQTPATRAAFKTVVTRGQLEFVGGGYVQSDEATTTFQDVIDQTTTGHEVLRRALDLPPPVHGWQLDMFAGYSSVTPSLWALAGYEAMVLRYEGNDTMRAEWAAQRGFQFVWDASYSLPSANASIFAHVINGNYGDLMGQGFDWEQTFKDPVHHPPINASNVAARAAVFVAFVTSRALAYQGAAMELWGTDFHFHNAAAQFGNMSLLVDYINAHAATFKVHVQFSTAAEYFDFIHATPATYPLRHGLDFLLGWPHVLGGSYNATAYQTGAQTSWPTYKRLVRSTGDLARATESAFALARAKKLPSAVNGSALDAVRTSRALTQHHDSMPGTMRTSVSSNESFFIGDEDVKLDYEAHLLSARAACAELLGASLAALAAAPDGHTPALVVLGDAGELLAPGASTLLAYNPLGWTRAAPVHVGVAAGAGAITVTDADGAVVPSQRYTTLDGGAYVSFVASAAPLGFSAFGVTVAAAGAALRSGRGATASAAAPVQQRVPTGADVTITNGFLTLAFSGATGRLSSIATRGGGAPVPVNHHYALYENATGGAYILYEAGPARAINTIPELTVTRGAVFETVCARYGARGIGSACFSVYKDAEPLCDDADVCGHVEIVHDVGPLELTTEVVARFSTDLMTGGAPVLHFQDSGMEAHPWVFNASLTIPGNYKALIHSSFLRLADAAGTPLELAVVGDRTMGSASLVEGQLEVMLARNLNASDTQGPWPLADPSRVRTPLLVLAGARDAVEAARPRLEAAAGAPLVLALARGVGPAAWRAAGFATRGAGLAADLPPSLALLSLFARDPATGGSSEVVLRVRHMYEAGVHPILSAPARVDVAGLLGGSFTPPPTAADLVEKTLTLSFDWETLHRRTWPVAAPGGGAPRAAAADAAPSAAAGDTTVLLGPMDIKTFVFVP